MIFLVELISIIFDASICIIYMNMMFGKRNTRINFIIWILSYIFMESLLVSGTFIHEILPSSIASVICLLTSIGSMFLITLLYNSNMIHRIFVVISFQVVTIIAEFLSMMTQPLLLSINPNISTLYLNIIFSFLSKFIIFILILIIGIIYKHKKHSITFRYSMQLILLPVISIIVAFCFSMMFNNYLDDKLQILITLIVITLLCAICVINYSVLNSYYTINILENNKMMLDKQLALQERQYEHVLGSFTQQRKLIHDFNKHLTYINECARQNNFSEINNYCQLMQESLANTYNKINTGNIAIDALVSKCINDAKDISVTTDIKMETAIKNISNYDICIILGNILDNALFAANNIPIQSDAFIKINILNNKIGLKIKILNSCCDADKPQKNKEALSYHGYGLTNISDCVNKYKGICDFYCDNNIFHSNIFISA